MKKGPIVLLILDGWGLSSAWRGNAVALADPPTFQRLWRTYPHGVLATADGPRDPRLIDSELQHATIGTGRWIRPDLEEISQAIEQDLFAKNAVLLEVCRTAAASERIVHLVGTASFGSIDADLAHLGALLAMCRSTGAARVMIHAITQDSWGEPARALDVTRAIENLTKEQGVGQLASLIGQVTAMPETAARARSSVAANLWLHGRGTPIDDGRAAIAAALARGHSDSTLPAFWLPGPVDRPASVVRAEDVVIIWNGRAASLNPIVRIFSIRSAPRLARLVTLVTPAAAASPEFGVAFPPALIPTSLPEILAGRDLTQLRVADPSHAAAVTRLFSGGRDKPYPGESHLLTATGSGARVPVDTLDALTDRVLATWERTMPAVTVWNIDAVDRAAHTGDLFAAAAAVRAVDRALDTITTAVLGANGTLLVTSDHGNAEAMLPGARAHHTTNAVPLLLIAKGRERNLVTQAITLPPNLAATLVQPTGALPDIAPTILDLLGIPVPIEMTGQSLLDRLR